MGLSKLCVENFLSQVLQRFVEELFCAVFQKLLVAKTFMEEKWGGGVSKYSVENFLSHSTETFFRGTLLCCVSEKFCWRKSLWKRSGEGEYRNLPSKIFCLKVPKIFEGESFSLSVISGIERICASEGYFAIFHRNFFVSQYRDISQRNPSVVCFRKPLVAKKVMEKNGEAII